MSILDANPADVARRILVIDNDASARRFVSAAFVSGGGREALAARNGAEAFEHLRALPNPDLIVCDLLLPEGNGCELIARMRASGVSSPILVLSSEQSFETMSQALQAGADDYLQKPADLHELRRAIAALISSAGEQSHPLTARFGAAVTYRLLEQSAQLEMTAATNSAQIESFERFTERLVASELSAHDLMNLRLALEEMIQNAREWGNQFDAWKNVRLSCRLTADRAVICVEDEGEGFDVSTLTDPSIDPKGHIQRRLASGKRIGGWGIFLTRKLMDEVVFNEKGNGVCLTKRFYRGNEARPGGRPAGAEETRAAESETLSQGAAP